jgi:competence protein ComEA
MLTIRLMKCATSLAVVLAVVLGAAPAAFGQASSKDNEPPKAKARAKAKAKETEKEKAAVTLPLDLNKASAEQLEDNLPGVGPATAKKIVEGRPYAKVDDLAKAGVPARTIDAIRNMVTVAAPPAVAAPAPSAPSTPPASTPKKKSAPAAKPGSGKAVNINTAPVEEIDSLPGIGPVKAKAIIEARPFKTIEDIMKVKGIKEGEFSKIKDLITVR